MKKIMICLTVVILLMTCGCVFEPTPLDYIHNYEITVNPNDDGTLEMDYYLKWEVLDEGNGGVSWIVVGVPNRFVSNIEGKSSNIKDIEYTSENGAGIEIDFNETYHKGDVFEVHFTFKQSRIFTIKDSEVQYSFNPGWFDEIKVETLLVKWNRHNVKNHNANSSLGDYLEWKESLDFGQTIDVNLVYDKTAFPNINPKEAYSSQTIEPAIIYTILAVFLVVIIIGIVSSSRHYNCYHSVRGFSGRIHRHHFYFGRYYGYRSTGSRVRPPEIINGSRSGVGSGCACACACACAGGGRAGCSRKDFNNYLKIQ